jgi:KipI family sensor histidine kinase inhibitor
MKPRLLPLGDSALLIQLGHEVDPSLNREVQALEARIRAYPLRGVLETVPAYASILVHYDSLELSWTQVSEWARGQIAAAKATAAMKPRWIEVPVQYGGEDGPDLGFVAEYHDLTMREVVRIHASREYTVYMMGFTPGFPYLGKLDEAIATPRHETPRARVAAGSVGIAAMQTGIYPIASPGGWRIIGRTRLKLFDPSSQTPFLFAPGDTVRFVVEAADA